MSLNKNGSDLDKDARADAACYAPEKSFEEKTPGVGLETILYCNTIVRQWYQYVLLYW